MSYVFCPAIVFHPFSNSCSIPRYHLLSHVDQRSSERPVVPPSGSTNLYVVHVHHSATIVGFGRLRDRARADSTIHRRICSSAHEVANSLDNLCIPRVAARKWFTYEVHPGNSSSSSRRTPFSLRQRLSRMENLSHCHPIGIIIAAVIGSVPQNGNIQFSYLGSKTLFVETNTHLSSLGRTFLRVDEEA